MCKAASVHRSRGKAMRRLFFCLVWAVIFHFVTFMIVAVIAVLQARGTARSYEDGYRLGYRIGVELRQHYFPYIVAGSLGLAVLGTLSGILPGTGEPQARRRAVSPQPRSGPGWRAVLITVVIGAIVAGNVWLAMSRPRLHPEQFAAVRVGMQQAEVEALLGVAAGDYSEGGEPTSTFTSHGNHQTWLGPERGITIFFDARGRVRETRIYPVLRVTPGPIQ